MGTTRQNNKLLYQRPSFEYYDVFRGPLIEHMIFYLTKTGGDARMFPENMPVQWFAEIYDIRFKIYNVLQRRKRLSHESTMARESTHDFHPIWNTMAKLTLGSSSPRKMLSLS